MVNYKPRPRTISTTTKQYEFQPLTNETYNFCKQHPQSHEQKHEQNVSYHTNSWPQRINTPIGSLTLIKIKFTNSHTWVSFNPKERVAYHCSYNMTILGRALSKTKVSKPFTIISIYKTLISFLIEKEYLIISLIRKTLSFYTKKNHFPPHLMHLFSGFRSSRFSRVLY